MPSAIASHPTLSLSQLSSSRRSAAARSVGSMRSKGPGMSPSRDRASSYVGPPSVKCATVSRVAPPSGGSHRMVAVLRPHACISVAGSTLAAWSTRRGGWGALMSEDTSPLQPTCGSGAACSQPSAAASHRWSGPAPRIMVGRGRVCGPHPSSGTAAYPCAGVPGARVAAYNQPNSRGHFTPTLRASHAVMEPHLMIHGKKRASFRCFGNPSAGPGTGGGPRAVDIPGCCSRCGGRPQSPC